VGEQLMPEMPPTPNWIRTRKMNHFNIRTIAPNL
jgi:hypothetical protein